jgi:hypothetical protein
MSDSEDDGGSGDEWITICDEKNIVLKKNDTNTYKIVFNINLKNKEDTVLNVLKNGQLFDLLSALNPDVISKVDVVESEGDDIQYIFMTFENGKMHQNESKDKNKTQQNYTNASDENDKIIHVFFCLKYIFKENKCIVQSQKFNYHDNEELASKIAALKKGKDFLSIGKIKLKAVESNKKTSISLMFKVDGKKSSNIVNMYIGLYFKKMFYRFKQYFE